MYTTVMELGPKRPSPLWFWGPISVVVKIRVPFWGTLNIRCRIILGTPKSDHNFDNYSIVVYMDPLGYIQPKPENLQPKSQKCS